MSILKTNTIQAATGTTVNIPTGQRLTSSEAAAIAGKGNIVNITHGTHVATMNTSSTSYVNHSGGAITVTKLLGAGNVAGGSYLMILGRAWIEYNGSGANGKALSWTLMRDGSNLTDKTYGFGNIYSDGASGFQTDAVINYVDPANLAAGSYVYSFAIRCSGSHNIQIGEGGRLGTWQILEIAQ